jgi:hypothetical protein
VKLKAWISQNPGGATQMMLDLARHEDTAKRVSWASIMRASRGEYVSERVASAISAYTGGSVPTHTMTRPARTQKRKRGGK